MEGSHRVSNVHPIYEDCIMLSITKRVDYAKSNITSSNEVIKWSVLDDIEENYCFTSLD